MFTLLFILFLPLLPFMGKNKKKCQKKNGLGKFFYMQNLVIKDQLYSLTIHNPLPLKILQQCSGCFLKTCSATDK